MLSKKQFFLKYILVFNIYGNVFLVLSIILFLFSLYLFNMISIIIAVFSAVSLYFGLRISMEYKKKYKYYFVTFKKIEKNGFNEDYFKWGFIDPCYRILSKYILMENNRIAEYPRLLKMFNTNDKVKNFIYNDMMENALKLKWD